MRTQGLWRGFPNDLENSRRTGVAALAAQVPPRMAPEMQLYFG